jgi:hypothetical protein
MAGRIIEMRTLLRAKLEVFYIARNLTYSIQYSTNLSN